jgi:thiamine biosynthesis lipoprotein
MTLRSFTFRFKAMACLNELTIYAENKQVARDVSMAAIELVNDLERRYSRYLPDSFLTRINESAGSLSGVIVDDETAAILNYAQTCYEQSEGLFDVTSGVLRRVWNFKEERLPSQAEINEALGLIGWDKVRWESPRIALPIKGMELDFGGIVKEYAADACANLCQSKGINHGMVNMGGDIHVIGPHPDGSVWTIGIQDPRDSDAIATSMRLKQGGLASSGDYQRFIEIDGVRYSHILNPLTGWPVAGLRAVSVVAPHCLIAGSTSTIAVLKGEKGKAWLAETDLPHLWFDEDGELFRSRIEESKTDLFEPES